MHAYIHTYIHTQHEDNDSCDEYEDEEDDVNWAVLLGKSGEDVTWLRSASTLSAVHGALMVGLDKHPHICQPHICIYTYICIYIYIIYIYTYINT
jgi:hypothetical protein